MVRQSGNRLRLAGLIGLGILLLLVPSGVGIYLLRQRYQTTTVDQPVPGEDSSSAISEEVYQSVLERPSDAAADSSPASTAAATNSRIKVLLDGSPVPVANGGAVTLNDDLRLEIFVSPYPPTSFNADVDMYLTTADGEPVTGAELDIMYDMMFMDHGPFVAQPAELGNGHYLTSYNLFMFGPWVLDTYIKIPGQEKSVSLPISIYVWPE